ncbi:alpha-1A adrenergic receptor-like [Paramacrobiotus metropolitanus]|uniref:alpha-1A adrenergic receptor-like n=1 Tax=Paramacrobiotus metropolitanus TaxID=2943436 RepID=UPI0024465092|nr:alpha-1A adrenergic receptor-like [Paramacrobiotus metropolitanus]
MDVTILSYLSNLLNDTVDLNSSIFLNDTVDLNVSASLNETVDPVCNNYGNWRDPLVLIELCFMSFIVVLNTAGLVSLLCRGRVNASFNIYIANLLLANVTFAVVENPLDLLFGLSCDRWIIGSAACDLFLYCNYVITAWAMHAHVLITVNRLWAVIYPYSYRRLHTVKIAVILCVGALVYVHMWSVPGIVMDSIFYRDSLEKLECELNVDPQRSWVMLLQICVYLAPIAFVGVSYGFIGYKHRQRLKVKQAGRTVSGLPSSKVHRPTANDVARGSGVAITSADVRAKERNLSAQAFVTLTLLTSSLLITWTPYEVLQMISFTLQDFKPPDELSECLDILWTLQAVLDPLLSTHLLADLRGLYSLIHSKTIRR